MSQSDDEPPAGLEHAKHFGHQRLLVVDVDQAVLENTTSKVPGGKGAVRARP
jgi:hypothetical protein